MRKVILVATFVLAAGTRDAAATNYQTTFNAQMVVGKQKIDLTVDGPIVLPSSLAVAGWSCSITNKLMTDDGSMVYRNIGCSHGDAIVVIEAACPRSAPGNDNAQMELRSNSATTTATLSIWCTTAVRSGTGT